MKTKSLILSLTLSGMAASTAQAHSMWLNLVPEPVEQHIIVAVVYGDAMPGSEMLSTDWGNMDVASYEVVAPDGTRSPLGVPKLEAFKTETLGAGLTLQRAGDTGIRKVAFGWEAKKGVYQVAARSPVLQYILYTDSQGEHRSSDQPYATLKDVKVVDSVVRDVFFMKAVHAVGGWSDPPALGDPFEIVALSDLATAKVGDKVRFKVLLNGKGWEPGEGSAQLNAFNPAYGDRWGLLSSLKYGEGEFRLPTAGLWRVDAHFKARSGEFAQLTADATKVPKVRSEDVPLYVRASLVFNVRP